MNELNAFIEQLDCVYNVVGVYFTSAANLGFFTALLVAAVIIIIVIISSLSTNLESCSICEKWQLIVRTSCRQGAVFEVAPWTECGGTRIVFELTVLWISLSWFGFFFF